MKSADPASIAMGHVVRGAIAQAGLNFGEAAPRLDMSRNTLSRRINGELPFTWPNLRAVSELTGVPTDELVVAAERRLGRSQEASA